MLASGIASRRVKGLNARTDRSLATQARIISVARGEFARHGFSQASLSTIVEKAEVTTGAIYHHYTDKKGLFRAVAESVEQEIMDAVTALPPHEDPWTAFTTVLATALEICARPEVSRIVFMDAPSVIGPEAWHEIELKYAYGMVQRAITDLSEAGVMDAPNPDLVAQILLGAVIEAAHAIARAEDRTCALESATTAILRMVDAFRLRPGGPPAPV